MGSFSRKMRDFRDLRKCRTATVTAKLLQRGGHRLTVVTQAEAIQRAQGMCPVSMAHWCRKTGQQGGTAASLRSICTLELRKGEARAWLEGTHGHQIQGSEQHCPGRPPRCLTLQKVLEKSSLVELWTVL